MLFFYLFSTTLRKIWTYSFATICLNLKRNKCFSTSSESNYDPEKGVLCSWMMVTLGWWEDGTNGSPLSILFPVCSAKNERSKKPALLEKVFFAASVPLSSSLCGFTNGVSWHGKGSTGSGSQQGPGGKGAVEIIWSSLQLKAGPWLSAVTLGLSVADSWSSWKRGCAGYRS